MTLALKRFKVYVKLFAIVAVVASSLLIVLMNQDNKAKIWFFKDYEQVNVLWLILITAILSIASWWIVAKIFATIRELRHLQHAQANQQQMAEQRRLAQEMAEREKRIDEKLRRSIQEEK
jgi:hypothetical protein